ncbi:ABC transporter C family member 3 [Quillaja saponaria]|uniref:ABC transporter C family member 3 n=1 Tax=Quillaja saponaria TaxID=32244 RepID=A0AAD7LT45_QUISA|nr:ABC transporter C family member 3 [Quillaja saponaria]
MHQFGYQQPIPENPIDIEANQTLHKCDLRGWGVTDYRWLHANHIAIRGMRYNLVQTGDLRGVAHGHAAHTPEYNEWYRRISRRYLTRVGLIHGDPAPSYSTHSTSSSSQRRRRSKTDVPGPSVSYGCVDADVRASDVYIPSPAHMSPPPYMASVQAEEGFSGADDIPKSEDLGDKADVPSRRNPARRRRPRPCEIVLFEKHLSLPIQYVVSDIISLFTGLLFCYVGFFVKNNCEDSLLQEPLLNGNSSVCDASESNKIKGGETVTPYSNAGFFSILTFCWMSPLIASGNKKTIDLEDVPQLASSVVGIFPAFREKL